MTPDIDDEERLLVKQLQSGDEAAFTALVVRWTPAMLRVATDYVPSRQVAEDVVQDTWLAVLTGIANFESRSSLRTWLFHILVRRAQQTGARERRSLPFTAVWRDERGPAVDPSCFHPADAGPQARGWISPLPRWDLLPDEHLRDLGLERRIELAIAALPLPQRRVVVARDIWDCKPEEICELFAITTNHQRVLLHRARSKLRVAVEQYLTAELDGRTQ